MKKLCFLFVLIFICSVYLTATTRLDAPANLTISIVGNDIQQSSPYLCVNSLYRISCNFLD